MLSDSSWKRKAVSLDLSAYGGESGETTDLTLRYDDHEHGELVIYAPPTEGCEYVIGADVAEATGDGDFSCGQVLRHDTLEQVAVWHGRTPPRRFGHELHDLGYFYNTAYIVVEFTGPGAVTCRVLYHDLGYPALYWREALDRMGGGAGTIERPGFVTSGRTKKLVLDQLATLLYDKQMVLHDEQTLRELLQFEHNYTKSGTAAYSAPAGRFDDRVMALALAVEGWRQYQPMVAEKIERKWADMGANVRTSHEVDDEDTGEAMLRWCHGGK